MLMMLKMMTSPFLKHLLVFSSVLVVITVGIKAIEGSGEEPEVVEAEWNENPDYEGVYPSNTCPCEGELKAMMMELRKIRSSFENLGTKIDPEFKITPEVVKEEKKCPHGFHYLPKAKGCYKIVYEEHDWTEAGERCRSLTPGAHLVAITTADENDALKRYLEWELRTNPRRNICVYRDWHDGEKKLWTAGHRKTCSCSSPFVWQLSPDKQQPMTYSHWGKDEPNCKGGAEICLNILPIRKNYRWNDIPCSIKLCPVCEFDISN